MGRGSQLFWFLNSEKMPTKHEIEHYYTGLSITDELKKFRRQWRKEHKEELEKQEDT